jgi:putative nucleotidyltransferase with HDIG domain
MRWPEVHEQFQVALCSSIEASTATDVGLSLVVVSMASPDHGQETGTLSEISPVLRMSAATHSIFAGHQVFRIGELECAAVCTACSEDEAAALARRVWLQLIRCSETDSMPLEVFAGVASIDSEIRTADELTSAARVACEHARLSDAEPVTVHRSIHEGETITVPYGLGTRAFRSTIRALAHAVDSRHPNTESHSENVSELAVALARVIDLSDEEIHVIGLAALMHDIGKIGVRDSVLYRTSSLSDVEHEELRDHVELGARILAAAGVDDVVPAVRHHHERWDGTGYPDGLAAHQIPLGARLIAICNTFVVKTSQQQHGTTLQSAVALHAIENEAGTGFDPELTATFVRLIRGLTRAGVN